MNFVAAKCPSCQGELQIPDNRDFVKCMYCGCDIKVRETISLNLKNQVPELLNLAEVEEKAFNYSKSDYYYTKVLELDSTNSKAWFGKGNSTLDLASNTDYSILELREMVEYFNKAIEYEDDKESLKIQIENNICSKVSVELIGVDIQFMIEMGEIMNFSIQCMHFIEALEYAKSLNPSHLFRFDHSKIFDCKTPEQLIVTISTLLYHINTLYQKDFQNYYYKYKK